MSQFPTLPEDQTQTLAEDAAPSVPVGAPDLRDYEVVGRLGEGGMGVVWRAVQRSTRREVALKLLSGATLGSERARVRFEREVELAARLEDPRIARVYDAGVENGLPYYAMQLVEGVPLDEYVRDHKPGTRGILELMRSVCEAVQHAHQRGIIHRDLKPSNILVAEDGRPVVVDFGLAKAMEQDDASHEAMTLSVEGQVAGTPAYMSPEQAAGRNHQIDTRSDVYSLGVILYRLLTGESPHNLQGPTLEVLRRIAEQDVKTPRSQSREVTRIIDRELETLLLKALSRNPDQRYDSAGALGQDISNYLSGEPLLAKRPTASYIIRKRLFQYRVPVSIAAAVVFLALAGTGGTLYYLYQRPVDLPIDSYPPGASIVLNGELKSGCGLTPCRLQLPPGEHRLELVHPGGFQPAVRNLRVSWGKVKGDAYEPISLMPDFRTVVFAIEPKGIPIRLVDVDKQRPDVAVNPPAMQTVPVGRYRVVVDRPGYRAEENAETLAFSAGLEPMTLSFKLVSDPAP